MLDANLPVPLSRTLLRSDAAPVIGPPQNLYSRNQAASVELVVRSSSELAGLAQPLLAEDRYFGCRLIVSSAIPRLTPVRDADAGASLTLTGPAQTLDVPKGVVPVLYLNVLPESDPEPLLSRLAATIFASGSWRLAAPGGAVFAPFQTMLQVPPPIRWTNAGAFQAVDRNTDQIVRWTGDGYGVDDLMTVNIGGTSVLSCRAPASAGQVTLPATLLQHIPQSIELNGASLSTIQIRLTPRPERRMRFDLPRVDGGIEHGIFDYLFTETQRVAIR